MSTIETIEITDGKNVIRVNKGDENDPRFAGYSVAGAEKAPAKKAAKVKGE